jgi:hypothetical protein
MAQAQPSAERDHLCRRVREEAEAAIGAGSMAATLIHLALATGYARRLSLGDTPPAAH